jgi:4-carboxymuconolactone decarboxylase
MTIKEDRAAMPILPTPRLPDLDPAALTPEQQPVYDAIKSGPRGVVYGPLAVWLRRPQLADRAQSLGAYCRYGSSLSPRLSEMAILVTARVWGSEFEWWAHKQHALTAGIAPSVIEAIRTHQAPALDDAEDQVVYDVATTLNRTRTVDDALYGRAIATLGEGRLIDLIGVLGYYTLISMTINTFQVARPDGTPPEL